MRSRTLVVLSAVGCVLVLLAGCNADVIGTGGQPDSTIDETSDAHVDGGSSDARLDGSLDDSDGIVDDETGTGCEVAGGDMERVSSRLSGPLPNRCCVGSEASELFSPHERENALEFDDMPWRHLSTGHSNSDSFEATYEGTVTLNSAVSLECPGFEQSLGLTCQTDQALSFSETGQSGATHRFVVPIPLDEVDLPATGSKVQIEYVREGGFGEEFTGLRIDTAGNGSSSSLILAVGNVQRPGRSNKMNDRTYEFAGTTFEITADPSDPHSAHCITFDSCPRLHRLEKIQAQASTTQTVGVGEKATLSSGGQTMTFWHAYSYSRAPLGDLTGWTIGQCADYWPPETVFAMARGGGNS